MAFLLDAHVCFSQLWLFPAQQNYKEEASIVLWFIQAEPSADEEGGEECAGHFDPERKGFLRC